MWGSPPLRWPPSRPLLRHHPPITSFQATINYPSVSIILTILAASPHHHRHSLLLSIWRLPLLSNGGFGFGQEFKGSSCFWQKKWKNVSVGARWRCYGRGKIAPDFFHGWFCATNALRLSNQVCHASRESRLFQNYFQPRLA